MPKDFLLHTCLGPTPRNLDFERIGPHTGVRNISLLKMNKNMRQFGVAHKIEYPFHER